jgi:hypothetical protein
LEDLIIDGRIMDFIKTVCEDENAQYRVTAMTFRTRR